MNSPLLMQELYQYHWHCCDIGRSNDLHEEQVERILSHLKPAMKKLLVIKNLLPYLRKWRILMESEEEQLRATVYQPSEQVGAKVTVHLMPLLSFLP